MTIKSEIEPKAAKRMCAAIEQAEQACGWLDVRTNGPRLIQLAVQEIECAYWDGIGQWQTKWGTKYTRALALIKELRKELTAARQAVIREGLQAQEWQRNAEECLETLEAFRQHRYCQHDDCNRHEPDHV